MTRTEELVALLVGGGLTFVCGLILLARINPERVAVKASETTQVCGVGCGVTDPLTVVAWGAIAVIVAILAVVMNTYARGD